MAHPFSDFTKFEGTPFERYILPIIPSAGPLDETHSDLSADHLGKIPGKFSKQTRKWVGFHGWQTHVTKPTDLKRWEGWQGPDQADTAIAVALNTRNYLAVDIDVDDAAIADQAQFQVTLVMGSEPIAIRRRHGSSRRVLIYKRDEHDFPIRKHRVAFKVGDKLYAVEFLGEGQQVIIEGPHAKGEMHYWQGDVGLIEGLEKNGSQLVGPADVSLAVQTLKAWIEREGWELVKASGREAGFRDPGAAFDINNQVSPHIARDRELLTRCVQAIDLDDLRIDYDTFVNLLRAICAAVAGDLDYLHDVVWPWVCTNQKEAHGAGPRTQERGVEWLEERWRSFHDSELGADYVYTIASLFGFVEGKGALAEDIVRAAGLVEEADTGAAEGSDGDAAGPGGPLPPGFADTALRDGFVAGEHGFLHIRELGKEDGWVKQQNGLWQPAYPDFAKAVSDYCSAVGDSYRTQGPQGAKTDIALKHGNTHARIENMLRKAPAVVRQLKAFDTIPYLLNTPRGIVDLRDGSVREQTASDLFRLCTAVSPNYLADPPARFMRVLEHMAKGRPWLVKALQLWFGYCLTGYVDWQLFLFVAGKSGSGKSLLMLLFNAIMGSYSRTKPEAWFLRGGEYRFDMDDLIGLRMVIGDETQASSTWNETRMSSFIGGAEQQAEIKGAGKPKFLPTAKININGNNRPHFVSGDTAGGLHRRLLLLEMLDEHKVPLSEQDEHLIEEILREEGDAVLAWAIEGAIEALKLGKKGFLVLAMPLVDAAKAYQAEGDERLQWINECLEIGDSRGDYILVSAAFESYIEFRRRDKRNYDERRIVFRRAMEDRGYRVEPVGRGEKDKRLHGLLCFYGLRFRGQKKFEMPEVGQVVSFPA